MIRVQVSEQMIKEARELLEEENYQNLGDRPHLKPDHLIMGAIGEIALIDYCWSNDLLAYKSFANSSDVQLHSGHKVEVKTQKVLAIPELHYCVNVSSKSEVNERSDFFFFTHLQYVAGTPEAVWLLGGCSWDKFWRLSTFHRQGDPMMRHYADGNDIPSGRYFTSDCHDLAISQLAPPSASLKHFKSLQQKEEAI